MSIAAGPQGPYGTGVPRARPGGGFAEHFRAPGVSEAPVEAPTKHLEGPWGEKPSVARQMVEFPNTWKRVGAEQYEFFELPKQKTELNKFMEGTFPVEAPIIQLTHRVESPTQTGVNVMLRYFVIHYMQISPSASLQPPTPAP